MNLYTLLGTLRTAIHDDSTLAAWCTTNYTRRHKVYVGVDLRNPPPDTEYPIVHVFPEGKSQGQGFTNMGHRFSVNVGLVNAAARTITGKASAIEMAGVKDIVDMTAAVLDIIAANVGAGYFMDAAETQYEDIDVFPYFISKTSITINRPQYQGADSFD